MHLFDEETGSPIVFLQRRTRRQRAAAALDGEVEGAPGNPARVAREPSAQHAGQKESLDGTAARGTFQIGLFGEEVVADGLRRSGWRVLGHRVRTRWGELDVIARRGDVLIFVEVKTSTSRSRELAGLVDERAQHRLRRAAVAWLAANPHLHRGVHRYRFDVFLVRRDRNGGIEQVDQIRNAF